MNLSDLEMLERAVKTLRIDPAVAYALIRIQHDLSKMMEKIDRIDAALAAQPREDWAAEQDDPTGTPF